MLSREDLVAVAVRLFSVFLFLGVIKQVPGVVQFFVADEQGRAWAIFNALALLSGALICVLLWFFPLSIARRLLPVMREPRVEPPMDASLALSVGLTLIGIWVLAYGFVDAIYWLTLLIRTRQVQAVYFEWSHEQVASVFATLAELAIGLWLVFGNAGIRRLIYRYRYGASLGAP
ncbi:MAG: hypothetical protein QM795_05070 [Pseudoxanthomonas sp.]